MTDATKEIFNGPWTADRATRELAFVVKDGSGKEIVKSSSPDTMKRVALLPELYDALMDAAGGKCWSCAGENTETMLDHPCPKGHDEDCYVAKWRELLRKVRDGE